MQPPAAVDDTTAVRSFTGSGAPVDHEHAVRRPLVAPYRSSDPVPLLDLRVIGLVLGTVSGTRRHEDGRCSVLIHTDHDGDGARLCEIAVEPLCFVTHRFERLFGETVIISAEDIYGVEPTLGIDLVEHERLTHCSAGWRLRRAYEESSTSGHHHAVAKRERTRAASLDHRAAAVETGCGCSAEVVIVTNGETVPDDLVLPKPHVPKGE